MSYDRTPTNNTDGLHGNGLDCRKTKRVSVFDDIVEDVYVTGNMIWKQFRNCKVKGTDHAKRRKKL